jgi:hypothetical protein
MEKPNLPLLLNWSEVPAATLPKGCVQCWHLTDGRLAFAGIMRVAGDEGFWLVIRLAHLPKTTKEKFPTLELAKSRASELVRICPVTPRALDLVN